MFTEHWSLDMYFLYDDTSFQHVETFFLTHTKRENVKMEGKLRGVSRTPSNIAFSKKSKLVKA